MSGTRNVSLAGAVVLSVLALVSCPAASPPVSPPPGALQVFQGSTELTSGTGYNYGTCIDLSSTAATFTVKNNTSATVNLNATTPYVVAGTDATDFHLTAVSGTRVLASGASATFDVSFAPSRTGAESATLTVNWSYGKVSLPLHGSGTL